MTLTREEYIKYRLDRIADKKYTSPSMRLGYGNNKYKPYKLITWKTFLEVFGEYIVRGNLSDTTKVAWSGHIWYLKKPSIEKFGTIVYATSMGKEKFGGSNFTHIDESGHFLYHKSWFVVDDFIEESEMFI